MAIFCHLKPLSDPGVKLLDVVTSSAPQPMSRGQTCDAQACLQFLDSKRSTNTKTSFIFPVTQALRPPPLGVGDFNEPLYASWVE